MPWPRVRAFVKRLFRSRASERALEEELRSYLEHEIDANARAGLAPADARRAALVGVGGVEQVKELVRDARSGAMLDGLWQDVRYAARTLVHAPGFSLAVIASLAVGIGATVAAFAFVNATLFRQLPGVANPDELVRVNVQLGCGRSWCDETTLDESRVVLRGLNSLEGVAAELALDVTATITAPRSVTAALVSDNYFETLGTRPSPGRAFAPGEGRGASVAVISHALWLSDFNADPGVVGRTMRVAGETVQIIGVAPRFFGGLGGRPEIWLPLALADRVAGGRTANWGPPPVDGEWGISYLGRSRDERLDNVWAQGGVLAAQIGAARAPGREGRVDVRRVLRSDLLRTSTMFVVFMAIPCLVLLIGCINAASLLLARATHRGHEIAVRLALGASRGRVARQLLLESLLLSLAAAAAALPAGLWGLQYAEKFFGRPLPLDGAVLAAGVVAAVVSAVGAGIVPALRVSAHRPALALGAAHGSDTAPRQSRMRRALVGLQVAISIGLLMSGAQLVSAFEGLYEKERIDPDRLVLATFDVGELNFREADTTAFYRELVERVRRLPQVEAAGVAGQTAFWTFNRGKSMESRVMAWAPSASPEHSSYAGGYAGGDLFRALGLRMLQGRDFAEEDRAGPRPLVAIVSRPLAEALFGPAALGQTIRVAGGSVQAASPLDVRIVGIVEPHWERGFSTLPTPAVFLPVPLAHQPALTLYVRSRVPIGALAPVLRDAVRQIDARVPIGDIATLRQRSERATPEERLAHVLAVFGIIAAALAAFGMYALFSYLVTMRARELAVRIALGADAPRILRLIIRQAMLLVAVGAAVGSPAAVIVADVINSEFHGMQGIDPARLAGTVAMFALTMLLASLVPAIRASRVDPISVLKQG